MKKISILFFFLFFSLANIFSQTTIQGVVLDSIGDPLIGTTVLVIGSDIGTTTDLDGSFSLQISYLNPVLEFSYTGYQSIKIEVKDSESLKVVMKERIPMISCGYVIYYDKSPLKINSPVPIMILRNKQLIRDNDFEMAPSLNRIPGVFMQTGTLNLNHISIRGVGARSRFSTRKIKAYLDDIPLNTADGSSAIEEIDLSIVDRVEVWKGPTASNYGAGLGGMIHLRTDRFYNAFGDDFVSSKFTGGSYGLIRNETNFVLSNKKSTSGLKINLNNTHSDGYRNHGEFDRKGATILGFFKPNDKLKTTILFNYSNGNSLNPSALNEEDWKKNPKSANPEYAKVGAFEKYTKLLFGISNQVEIAKIGDAKLYNKTSLFGNIRNSEEKDPNSFYNKNRQNLGLRTSFELNENGINPFYKPKFSMGVEVIQEDYENSVFDLLDGEKDLPLGDFLSLKNTINFFAQSYFEFNDNWTLMAGANLNQLNYTFTRDKIGLGKGTKEKRAADWILSPTVGMSYEIVHYLTFFSSVSHGLSPARTNEIFPNSSELDNNVQPETGWSFEVGLRGNLNYHLKYELSFYQMNIDNYLVYTHYFTRENGYVNSGKTQFRGMEGYVEYDFDYHVNGLIGYASYSFNESKFIDFNNGHSDFSGNQIPGTPQHHFNLGFDYRSSFGLYSNLNYRYVDAFPMNDDNSIFSDSYEIINFKLGFRKQFSKKIQFDLFAGIQNLSNTKYTSMIRVQRNIYNNSNPDFFYSGLPRNLYGGISMKFDF